MKGEIRFLKAGLSTSIQDKGRWGYAKYGVPRSGAMDQNAFFLANALLGNDPNVPVLEWTMIPPEIHFSEPTIVACTGANVIPKLNGNTCEINHQIFVPRDSVLELEFVGKGVFGYIGIQGGFFAQNKLSSCSMYTGVTKNVRFRKEDSIGYTSSQYSDVQYAALKYEASYLDTNLLNVYPGPEYYLLSKDSKVSLAQNNFSVSSIRSRMGVQLVESVSHGVKEILTSPVMPGTVQLTPSGTLVILLRDCQTTGGYPRIFQLDEDSINTLVQKQTNEKIIFKLIV